MYIQATYYVPINEKPAGCLLAKGTCSHLKATWPLVDISETSHSKSSPANFQHQYLAELLVDDTAIV